MTRGNPQEASLQNPQEGGLTVEGPFGSVANMGFLKREPSGQGARARRFAQRLARGLPRRFGSS